MEIKVFQMNDYDWWAGADLESIKPAFAKSYGYTVEECEADRLIDNPRPLTDEEMDRLQFIYDWPERNQKTSFRLRLKEMVETGTQMPCMFASTEY